MPYSSEASLISLIFYFGCDSQLVASTKFESGNES